VRKAVRDLLGGQRAVRGIVARTIIWSSTSSMYLYLQLFVAFDQLSMQPFTIVRHSEQLGAPGRLHTVSFDLSSFSIPS